MGTVDGTVTGPEWTDISMTDLNGTFTVSGAETGKLITFGKVGATGLLDAQTLKALKVTGEVDGQIKAVSIHAYDDPLTKRSEERRVGKECRSRRSTDH